MLVSENTGKATFRIVGSLGIPQEGVREQRMNFEHSLETPIKLEKALEILAASRGIELRRDSILILVNGLEAGVLEDLDTLINRDDEVVIIPMFHGG